MSMYPEGKNIRMTRLSGFSVLQHCKQVDTSSPRYDWRKAKGTTKCHIIRSSVVIEETSCDVVATLTEGLRGGVTAIFAGVLGKRDTEEVRSSMKVSSPGGAREERELVVSPVGISAFAAFACKSCSSLVSRALALALRERSQTLAQLRSSLIVGLLSFCRSPQTYSEENLRLA